MESHSVAQQKESRAQTHASQEHPPQPGESDAAQPDPPLELPQVQSVGQLMQSSMPVHEPFPQPPPAHPPQSSVQVTQSSPPPPHWHTPSPQTQVPQSTPQDPHVSLTSHRPSPHTAHVPQSNGHVEHVSPKKASQNRSPHKPPHGPQSSGQIVQSSVNGSQ